MKGVIYIIFSLLLYCSSAFSQIPRFLPNTPELNYYDIVAIWDAYFDQINQGLTESEIYAEEGDYNSYLRFKKYWEPKVNPHGDIALYLKMTGLAQEFCLNTNPGQGEMFWNELGPVRTPLSINQGIGPIDWIQIHPIYHDKMLCGSNKGGIFYSDGFLPSGMPKWENGGSDTWFQSGCRNAVFHPTDPDTWYAFSNKNDRDVTLGYQGGVLRTQNKGVTWERIGFTTDLVGASDPTSIKLGYYDSFSKITIHPTNPNNLYLCTTNGLIISTNANAITPTWSELPVTSPLYNIEVLDYEIRPDLSNYHFASALVNGTSPTCKFIWSNDNGATYIDQSLPASIPATIQNITIELSAVDPNYAYVLFDLSGNAEVWGFNMLSATWSFVGGGFGAVIMGRGNAFGVAQTGLPIVHVGRGILGGRIVPSSGFTPYGPAYHVDIEDLVCHPTNNGEVWMANHGGVSKSLDFGNTWQDMSDGLGVAQVIDMSTSRLNSERISIGLNHDGTLFSQPGWIVGTPPDWKYENIGDGTYTTISYDNDDNVWTSWQWPNQVDYTSNYGGSLSSAGGGQDKWNGWVEQNSSNPSVIYSSERVNYSTYFGNEVIRSENNGLSGSYDRISNFNIDPIPGLENYSTYSAYNPDVESNHLYALVTSDLVGYLFRTKQAEDPAIVPPALPDWERMRNPRPDDAIILGFEVDLEDPNIYYTLHSSLLPVTFDACDGTGIFYKVDYNYAPSDPEFITDMTYNLPNIGVGGGVGANKLIALEKGTDGGIYISTTVGVFYINNKLIANGTNWVYVSDNLPALGSTSLEINYLVNKIRLGTLGRGVWESSLYCDLDLNINRTTPHIINDFLEAKNDITSTAVVNSGTDVHYRGGNCVELLPTSGGGFEVLSGAEFEAFIHKCNAPGNSFKSLQEDERPKPQFDEDTESIKIYPNPSTGIFNLTVESRSPSAIVKVFNATGQLIYSQAGSFKAIEIDLSNQQSGIYLVRYSNGEEVITRKIVKD